ncbi:Uncharacterised protein [Rothia dentocariosa]|uniref:Uncharacterized protein n=1 Tax=Rothia dentocariosa TaxID=2047 RepID=A0A448UXM1_9MICC|nr:Uncharacterised protein [Rothia dentocariosa]
MKYIVDFMFLNNAAGSLMTKTHYFKILYQERYYLC